MSGMANTNAQAEFLTAIGDQTQVRAAYFSWGDNWDDNETKDEFFLVPGYNPAQWEAALNYLNRMYDSGFGGQQLFGTIWGIHQDWWERGEYDGSEWWCYMHYPRLEDNFSPADMVRYHRQCKLQRIINP